MQRPNILMIMADQFRTATLDGMGDQIPTPNIKRIMDKGMVFDRACCPSPLCTPSRAALATGKYPHRCGVMIHDTVLPTDIPTYYQALRKSGYRVTVVGKTDLHKKDRYCGVKGNLPSMYQYGFTDPIEIEGKMNCARIVKNEDGSKRIIGPYQKHLDERDLLERLNEDYVKRMKMLPKYYANPSVLPAEDFQDAFIGRVACEWLSQVENDVPWHHFVSFAGPHNPWDPPMEEFEKYKDTVFPAPIEDNLEGKPTWIKKRSTTLSEGMTSEDVQHLKRCYAASVNVIDYWVGQLLDILEQRGLMDNTVIIFCADHGELLADHGLFEKKAMYEASVRIPLVISCPWMKSRSDRHELADLMDLAPTCMELAGLPYDKEDMDARSLLPILRGEDDSLRDVQISELINCQMAFDGRYKWIRNWNDIDELYDLENDPLELHNIIKENPQVIQRLKQQTFIH